MNACLLYVSIKPNHLCTYIRYDSAGSKQRNMDNPFAMPTDTRSHGLMSYKANKRVRLAIDWLIYLSKDKPLYSNASKSRYQFKLNFITLTLSSKQKHTDNEIKSTLLNQFLTELRQKYKATNYLWRAEAQANGNIHFHIVTDVFIPWRTLRTDWNRIQEKLGYVSRFTEKTKKSDPNSTDVHSVNAIKNLSSYLAKYCSKNSKGYTVLATKAKKEPFKPISFLTYKHPRLVKDAKFFRQIHGKLWGLSQILSKYQSCKTEVANMIEKELEWLRNKKASCIKYKEMATVYMVSAKQLFQYKCMALYEKFTTYAKEVLNPPIKEPPKVIFNSNIFGKPVTLEQGKLIFV